MDSIPSDLKEKCITKHTAVHNFEWLCITCETNLNKGHIRPQANANNLECCPVPLEFEHLTPLEMRLISGRYPFMKYLALPKGKQSGLRRALVNVPVNEAHICSKLPRMPSEAGIIPLKLKRCVSFKGHEKFQYIRSHKILSAVNWLKQNNQHYNEIEYQKDWQTACHKDPDLWKELTGNNESHGSVDCILTSNEKKPSEYQHKFTR